MNNLITKKNIFAPLAGFALLVFGEVLAGIYVFLIWLIITFNLQASKMLCSKSSLYIYGGWLSKATLVTFIFVLIFTVAFFVAYSSLIAGDYLDGLLSLEFLNFDFRYVEIISSTFILAIPFSLVGLWAVSTIYIYTSRAMSRVEGRAESLQYCKARKAYLGNIFLVWLLDILMGLIVSA